jgi:hypothetical protein
MFPNNVMIGIHAEGLRRGRLDHLSNADAIFPTKLQPASIHGVVRWAPAFKKKCTLSSSGGGFKVSAEDEIGLFRCLPGIPECSEAAPPHRGCSRNGNSGAMKTHKDTGQLCHGRRMHP